MSCSWIVPRYEMVVLIVVRERDITGGRMRVMIQGGGRKEREAQHWSGPRPCLRRSRDQECMIQGQALRRMWDGPSWRHRRSASASDVAGYAARNQGAVQPKRTSYSRKDSVGFDREVHYLTRRRACDACKIEWITSYWRLHSIVLVLDDGREDSA